MLITTLPSAHKRSFIENVFSHPAIDGARYNVGVRTYYGPLQALSIVNGIASKHSKKLWVDLKGRQLRITKWADPTYGDIELNHEIEVDLPAKICFRGDDWSNVIGVSGNKIIVEPDPKHALGAGQAVNIIGNNLKVKGKYLTNRDIEYIEAAKKLKINDFMLSFVEQESDIEEILKIHPDAKLVLKIESIKGLHYVAKRYKKNHQLMAARDDLMINIGPNKAEMIKALELIIEKDPDAIAASHLLTSLDTVGYLMHADISDLRLLQLMGYKNFLFSDSVAYRCFDKAVEAWLDFLKVCHE